jgi:hypothetical protein
VKKTLVSTAIATVLAFALAACSSTSGAKQIVLHPATGETATYVVGTRANIVGDLDLKDATVKTFDVVIEEQLPGGSWTQFRKFVAHSGSTSIGFALIQTVAGDYQYRATISGKSYGPFTSAPITVHYTAKK